MFFVCVLLLVQTRLLGGSVDVLGSSVSRFDADFCSFITKGLESGRFAAFETFPSCLPFGVFLVIPEGFHGVFVHRLNGTFIINVNHYRKCWNAYVCTNRTITSHCLWNSAQILMEEFLSENVAKALLAVASVDHVVDLTVLQYRFQQEFWKNCQRQKSLFQHSEGYYEDNKCMQTKFSPVVLFFVSCLC